MDRQQQHPYAQRPAYPQISTPSTTQSVFQSSSSLSSISSVSSSSTSGPHLSPMSASSAPMPSPSTGQPMHYFASMTSPTTRSQTAQLQRQQEEQERLRQQHQQRMQSGASQQVAPAYVGQRGDGQGLPETTPFLQDFSLVAEAAKRAQMACLARDLGDVGL